MKETSLNNEIENWKEEIQSENWEVAFNAAESLSKIGGEDIVNFLIELLDSDKPRIRNAAALSIREIKNNRAIEPLLKSIFKTENRNYNGTMVYALETLDCKNHLVELFKILFYESYESKMGAYTILDKQIFEFSREDLMKIQMMWKECNDKSQKVNGFYNEETILMMKDTYEGFMVYLKEENKPIS